MYDIGRQVFSKSTQRVAHVTERNWAHNLGTGKRKAVYLISWQEGALQPKHFDFLTDSKDLTPADNCCDACNKWKPESQGSTIYQRLSDGSREPMLWICWFCEHVTYKNEGI